ncbi:glyoxalase/bleomycin resistance/dioxygenase family protein [Thermomonospora umbrina]|uniref:Uncharacterized protein n=1 Tax=Thermomonospora umbrina TaxID=111806 RepID=A0A3D9T1M9_9ACTN|nr:glyoxalase/bleomycin resistance/dioxygenase family protein [Thermomonospora umbrina]REE97731.1 hypothetical protein DFJ69_3206 [Thermomonospora umbrina]
MEPSREVAGPRARHVRTSLLVIYSPLAEDCRRFYEGLGLEFALERHGAGPAHYAAVLSDGAVFEIYPATAERRTGALRLGFAVDATATTPRLDTGRHLLRDPDGRTVEVHVD